MATCIAAPTHKILNRQQAICILLVETPQLSDDDLLKMLRALAETKHSKNLRSGQPIIFEQSLPTAA